jgi:FkbM family methyltransferase
MEFSLKNYFNRKSARMKRFYLYYIKRDPFTRDVKRWFQDDGDQKLRLDYALDVNSIVIDVGGYLGDFASDIHEKYGCLVYVFEPDIRFFTQCKKRFSSNSKVRVFNYGLSSRNAELVLSDDADGSSFSNFEGNNKGNLAKVRKLSEVIEELDIKSVDLLKVNIEGDEYPLLNHIIAEGLLPQIQNIQVQFHEFIKDAEKKRSSILSEMEKTHQQTWCYTFVWENWSRK